MSEKKNCVVVLSDIKMRVRANLPLNRRQHFLREWGLLVERLNDVGIVVK